MTTISRKTVLIVEDEDLKARTIQRTLAHKFPGFGWARASSFAEARDLMNQMEEAGEKPFSLVITDANMPIEDGSERSPMAFRFVIRDCKLRGIPTLVVSGMRAPQGFKGDWIHFNGSDLADRLTDAFRRGVGWPGNRPSARRGRC